MSGDSGRNTHSFPEAAGVSLLLCHCLFNIHACTYGKVRLVPAGSPTETFNTGSSPDYRQPTACETALTELAYILKKHISPSKSVRAFLLDRLRAEGERPLPYHFSSDLAEFALLLSCL